MSIKRPSRPALPQIGWKEEVRLPELHSGSLTAKIDTGARSSALHAEYIVIQGRRVTFRIGTKKHKMKLAGAKRIKSSNGLSEMRPVIETEMMLGQYRFVAAITLTDRADMGVPMLLGREAIKGRFLVNAGRIFVLGRRKFLK